MMSRSAAIAASLFLVGTGTAYAAEASGEVAYVDAQHKTMSLVAGPEFTLTDSALSKIQGSDWEGRHVIVVYQEKDGQKLASDVVLAGTDLQQQRQRNRTASAGSPGISGINPATNAQPASRGSGSGISGINPATKG
jgi:hypothetical protein